MALLGATRLMIKSSEMKKSAASEKRNSLGNQDNNSFVNYKKSIMLSCIEEYKGYNSFVV